MKQLSTDNQFPPIINGRISEIYPWNDSIGDHLTFFVYCIKNFLKLNSEVQIIDKKIKDFFVCENICLVDSGRSALLITLKTLGLKNGEEVFLSAFNCTAVAESILQAGGVIRFININSNAGLDIDSLKRAVNSKTKCIIVTHIYGLVDNLEELSDFCKTHGIFLINDLAQTLEDPSMNKKLNIYGDMSIYSFGPEKHLFALGGGALVTHRSDLIDQIKNNLPKETVSGWSLFLVLSERWKYYFTFFSLKYLKVITLPLKHLGIIYNFSPFKTIYINNQSIEPKLMHSVQKSLLIKKLKSYKIYINKTIENFNYLKHNLNCDLLCANQQLPLYATLSVDAKSRFSLSEYLGKRGVQTVWNYLPLYKAENSGSVELKETEELWQKVLSVPFRYPMTSERLVQVCEIINSYTNNANSKN